MESIDARIERATDDFFDEFKKENTPTEQEVGAPSPRDYYADTAADDEKERRKSYPNGAKAKLMRDVENAIKPLTTAFCVSSRNYDRIKERGDSARARMVADQYMEDKFLPAVEVIVRMNSADELLNAPEAMRKLDELVLIPGRASSGYTKAYLRSMYSDELGEAISKTDAVVSRCIREITGLLAAGQVRTAVGKATKMVDAIDAGKNIADEADYDILQKIVARGK